MSRGHRPIPPHKKLEALFRNPILLRTKRRRKGEDTTRISVAAGFADCRLARQTFPGVKQNRRRISPERATLRRPPPPAETCRQTGRKGGPHDNALQQHHTDSERDSSRGKPEGRPLVIG